MPCIWMDADGEDEEGVALPCAEVACAIRVLVCST